MTPFFRYQVLMSRVSTAPYDLLTPFDLRSQIYRAFDRVKNPRYEFVDDPIYDLIWPYLTIHFRSSLLWTGTFTVFLCCEWALIFLWLSATNDDQSMFGILLAVVALLHACLSFVNGCICNTKVIIQLWPLVSPNLTPIDLMLIIILGTTRLEISISKIRNPWPRRKIRILLDETTRRSWRIHNSTPNDRKGSNGRRPTRLCPNDIWQRIWPSNDATEPITIQRSIQLDNLPSNESSPSWPSNEQYGATSWTISNQLLSNKSRFSSRPRNLQPKSSNRLADNGVTWHK